MSSSSTPHSGCVPSKRIALTCDVAFVAVQTPTIPLSRARVLFLARGETFDYAALREATGLLARAAATRRSPLVVNVVSTVLPATMAREIEPLLAPMSIVLQPVFHRHGKRGERFRLPRVRAAGNARSGNEAVDERVLLHRSRSPRRGRFGGNRPS